MFSYYTDLALRSLKRNPVLTGLMIAAIAFGISACMTTLTVFRAMSADPIPAKSHQLFAPQIQNSAPTEASPGDDGFTSQLTY
jgi:putative ABC transport system permease protein